MTTRFSGPLAWGTWALCLGLTVLALVLDPTQAADELAFLAFPTVGALVASRRPENPIGWLFCALGLPLGVERIAKAYATDALIAHPGAGPGAEVAAWLVEWLWVTIVVLLTMSLLLFPDGRPPSRRWRPVLWLVWGAAAVVVGGFMFAPGPLSDADLAFVVNPFGLAGLGDLLALLAGPAFVLLVGSFVASVASLGARLRRAKLDERQQLKWVAYAAGVMVFTFVADLAGSNVLGVGAVVPGLVGTVALAGVPTAAGVAILRYHLYDIDFIINRTLVYATLTAGVVGLYMLVVGGLGAQLQANGNLAISLLATGLIAVLFQPLRERLQRGVNHLLYGQRDEPYAVLSRLMQRLEGTLAPEAVLPSIIQTVREALKLPYAAIALRQADNLVLAGASGEATMEVLRLPLVYQHESVGELRLGARGPGEAWSPADRQLLGDLARQAGVAAHAVRLAAELQHSRERLVSAREEERRRLRRDLHDELAPTLAALALTAATARDRTTNDPTATALLEDLYAGLRSAVGDIRRLVYELRPPALDELGLVAAIRERAAAYNGSRQAELDGLQVTVDAPERLPPLPAAVEVAAYRIVQEALMNVARHAQAHTCTIRLVLEDGLQVEVSDDGVGLPETYRAGVGLASMRERALELGGRCRIERRDGFGTLLQAWLPFSMEAPTTS